MTERRVMDADDVRRALTRIAHEMVERHAGTGDLILVKRNYGNEPDERRDLVDSEGWEGPAVYPPALVEQEAPAP